MERFNYAKSSEIQKGLSRPTQRFERKGSKPNYGEKKQERYSSQFNEKTSKKKKKRRNKGTQPGYLQEIQGFRFMPKEGKPREKKGPITIYERKAA